MAMKLGAKAQAVALLLAVATSGAVAGVVGDRLLTDRSPATSPAPGPSAEPPAGGPPGGGPGPWRWEAQPGEGYAQRLAASLELTPTQQAAIDSIMDDQQDRLQELNREVQPRFRAIAQETREGIEAVLTDQQRARLQDLREQRMRVMRPGMREMMRDRRDDGRPDGPGMRGPGGGNGARGRQGPAGSAGSGGG